MAKTYTDKDLENLHSKVWEEIREGLYDKRSITSQSLLNHYFLIGKQWIQTQGGGGGYSFHVPLVNPGFPTPTTNHIQRLVAIQRGRYIKSLTLPTVSPNTNSIEDKRSAEYGTHFLNHRNRKDREMLNHIELIDLLLRDGRCFKEEYYDYSLGSRYAISVKGKKDVDREVPHTGCAFCGAESPGEHEICPICEAESENLNYFDKTVTDKDVEYQKSQDELTEAEKKSQWKTTGDIVTKVRSLHEVTLEPYNDKIKKCSWLDVQELANKDDVNRSFGLKGKFEITDAELESGEDGSADELRGFKWILHSSKGGYGEYGRSFLNNKIIIHKHWKKPSEEHPEGLTILLTSRRILAVKPTLPYYRTPYRRKIVEKTWPVTAYQYENIPGTIWAQGLVERLIPCQMQLNQLDSHIIEWMRTSINSKLIIPTELNIKNTEIDGVEGLILEYEHVPGAPEPRFVPGTSLPSDVWHRRQELVREMEELAGAKDPAEVMPASGVAFAEYTEVSTQRDASYILQYEESVREDQQLKLVICQQEMSFNQNLKVAGEDGVEIIEDFNSSMIGDNIDVVINLQAGKVRSQALRSQHIWDGADRGLIDFRDPMQRDKALKLLTLDEFTAENDVDIEYAERVVDRLKNGEKVERGEFDNDNIMWLVVRKFFISSGAEKIFEKNEDGQMIEQNATNLLNQYAQEIEAEMQKQAGLEAGIPPEGGEQTQGSEQTGNQEPNMMPALEGAQG